MTSHSIRLSIHAIRLIVISIGILFLSGCLDWLSQDIHLARSRDGKDLYMLIVYRGLHATEKPEKAIGQLNEVVVNGEMFAINDNWIGAFRKEQWRDGLEKEIAKPDAEKSPAAEAFLRHAIAAIDVRNGGLFQNAQTGRLDGWQIVKWSGVDEGLRLANAAINEGIAQDTPSQEDFPLTDVAWIIKAGAGGYQWAGLNGSAIEVRFPVNPKEKAKFKQGFYEMLSEGLQSDETTTSSLAATIQFLSENSLSLIEKSDEFRIVLGDPGAASNQLILPLDQTKLAEHSNNLTDYAKTLPAWRGPLDPNAPAATFLRDPEAAWAALPVTVSPADDEDDGAPE